MVPGSHEIDKYKNFNNITRLLYPICSGIEDKPFGSEMRRGRGVCDIHPIPELEINKLCKYEYNKSVEATTVNIDNVALDGYSESSLLFEQYDFGKKKEMEKQCLIKYPGTHITSIGLKILDRNLRKHFFDGSKQKLNKIPSYSCDRNSSEETSECNSQNTPAMCSMRLLTEHDHFYEDLSTTYKDTLEKGSQNNDVKPIGPFTEPPNPGKQMKLGEPRRVRNRMDKDFYTNF